MINQTTTTATRAALTQSDKRLIKRAYKNQVREVELARHAARRHAYYSTRRSMNSRTPFWDITAEA